MIAEWLEQRGGDDFCYLTTTGRRSGRPHTVEMWFGAATDRLYMLSGGGEASDWVRNLMREPRVELRLGSETRPARAYVVSDSAEDALARRLLAAKYRGWSEGAPLDDWAATALPVGVTFDS